MEAETKSALEIHALVELMGHTQIAGKVTEVRVAETALLRVEVPDRTDEPGTGFERLFSPKALYGITPWSAEDVQRWVDYYLPQRVAIYLPQLEAVRGALAAPIGAGPHDPDDGEVPF